MARQIALLTNPTAGGGRGRRTAAIALPRLEEAGFEVHDLIGADADEARALAHRAVADGVESLVVCGGDGMVHLALQAVAGTGTNLGIIPAGTGNDVARYFGIPRKDPQAAADVVVGSRVRTVDLGHTGMAYFAAVLAAGFDSLVNERANAMAWPRGQMRYNLATLAELRVFEPLPYTLVVDGEERRFEAMMVAIGNGPSFGGGLRIAEGAVLDDGLLDVVVIGPMSKRRLVASYPKLFTGTISRLKEYEHQLAREVTVAAPGITGYADGERIGALPLTVTAVPNALRVLVP